MYWRALHSDVMGDTAIETRPANPKANEWAERIAAQQRSGITVKQFCKEQGLTEYSFYAWRKRLQESGPVRFALVERSTRRQDRTTEPVLERVLATGERLRIGTGVDIPTCGPCSTCCEDDPPAGQRQPTSRRRGEWSAGQWSGSRSTPHIKPRKR